MSPSSMLQSLLSGKEKSMWSMAIARCRSGCVCGRKAFALSLLATAIAAVDVPVPVTGALAVGGDDVVLSGRVTAAGSLSMLPRVRAVLSPGTVIEQGGRLVIRLNQVAPSVPTDGDGSANSVAENAAVGTSVGITAVSSDPEGATPTYALQDNAGGRFAINGATGVVTVAGALDYEQATSHNITVRATDGSFTADAVFTIQVTNVNDVAPGMPFDADPTIDQVAENSAIGTVVGVTVRANDADGPALVYSLIDNAGGRFAINVTTGVVTVAGALDREQSTTQTIVARASDGLFTADAAFTIIITDVNDVAPIAVFDANSANNAVAENVPVGTAVGITAQSYDADGPVLSYSLTENPGNTFTINSTTGVVTTAVALDYETAASYVIKIRAYDGVFFGPESAFTITLINVNDLTPSAPQDANASANAVAENAPLGTLVGFTAAATDGDGDAVAYALADSAGGRFAINPTTGVVTVAGAIDYEAIPAPHTLTIQVVAGDGVHTSAATAVAIDIANLNDVTPTIPTDANTAANTVAENAAVGSIVGLTAASVDADGPAPTYALTDNAGGRFAINATTGVVTVAAALDRETAASHVIRARAHDGADATKYSNDVAFSIEVTNVNDVPPTALVDVDTAINTVAENASIGAATGVTMQATDADGPALVYTLTDSAGGRFAINSATGVVTVAGALDHEMASAHAVKVKVTDGDFMTENSLSITVTNVNDVAPTAPTDGDAVANTVLENALVGTTVGLTAVATDVDGPVVSYSLFNNAGGRFAINASTGVVTVAGALDYETATSHVIIVRASDGELNTDAPFTIAVGPVDDPPSVPVDGNGAAANQVSEKATVGTAVGITAQAIDPEGSALVYSLTNNAGGRFTIGSGTGIVTVAAALDYETATAHTIRVKATDIGGKFSEADFLIDVINVDENPPVGANLSITVEQDVVYRFVLPVSDAEGGALTVNFPTPLATKGVVTVDGAMPNLKYTPNLHANGSDTFTYKVSDGTNWSPVYTVTVTITPSAVPIADPQSVTTNEDTAKAITLAGYAPSGTTKTWAITTSPGHGTLTGTAPNLTYTPASNYFGADSFQFVVRANGTPSAPATVAITVAAINDKPTITSIANQTLTEGASVVLNFTVGDVETAVDSLTVAAASSNTTALPLSALVLGGSGAARTLTITAPTGAVGSSIVTLTVSDGAQTSFISFQVQVQDTLWASLPAQTIYVIASETVYPTETTNVAAADKLTTSYAYQWHPGGNQIAQKTTTLPVVTTATNGPNTASTIVETYDLQGRPVWTKDADGYVHYRAYDGFSGAVTTVIQDVNTAQTSDFLGMAPFTTPTTAANPVAGGLHLKTQTEVDALGRPTKVVDAKGSVTYTVYKDADHEVRVYPGWDSAQNRPTGPTRVMREDWGRGYREVLTMSVAPAVSGGRPTGTEAIAEVRSLKRELLDDNQRVQHVDTYVDLTGLTYSQTTATLGTQRIWAAPSGVSAGNFERQTQTYMARGFPERVLRADGTIERTVTDFLGRVTARWIGTNDSGWSASGADLADFKKVYDVVYDGGGVGLGLPTLETAIGDTGGSTSRISYSTTHQYDVRGRRIATLGPDGILTTRTLDNLDRVLQTDTWSGIASIPVAPAVPPAANLRGRTVAQYDALGRVWKSTTSEVQGAEGTPGTVGDGLVTQHWYDRRGNLLKSQSGTAGAFSKARFDGVGRAIYAWTAVDSTDGTSWTNARTSTSDAMAEAVRTYYDAVGNVITTTRYLRKDNATTTGDLTSSNSHPAVQVRWYDLAHRPIAVGDYGRDNATTRYVWNSNATLVAAANGLPLEAVNAPRAVNSSNDYRITTTAYDLAGRPYRSTDNLGRVAQTSSDAAGRPLETIANYVDGVVGAAETDTDQTTRYEYAVGGAMAIQRVLVANGTGVGEQITRYLRTSTVDRRWTTATILPDSTETQVVAGGDQVQTTYDRLGRVRTRTDQRGVVHTYLYDAAGRPQVDQATTVPAGVDGGVRRIETAYDDLGRPQAISSWNAVSSGTKLNEVRRAWNAWGQLTASAQAHDGTATIGTSPTVGYQWDDGAASTIARSLRLTGITYPSVGYGVTIRYPASGQGAALDRAEAIVMGGQDIAQVEYLGRGTLARLTLPRAGNARVERSASAGAGGYTRYWEIGSHAWAAGTTQLDGWNFNYDRGGRMIARRASALTTRTDRDDVMGYDGLDRVTALRRGQATTAGALTASASRRDWLWTLDQAGNWRNLVQDADGGAGAGAATTQARSHNLANEIDTTDAHGDMAGDSVASATAALNWVDPTYDAAGAMATIPAPGAETTARTLTWDAWGRLVAVAQAGSTIWTASYDGQHRLIQYTAGGSTKDLYLDEQGREVEVRTAGVLTNVNVWSLQSDRLLHTGSGSGSITTWYAVLTDQQGSVTALVTDGTSTVVERYRYDAYGVRTIYAADGVNPPATPIALRYGYTGRPFDATMGLGYFRARWYHASLGRFISRDPAGYIDGGNLYQYVRGNPLWFIDPWGLAAALAEPPLREKNIWDWIFPQFSDRQREEMYRKNRNSTDAQRKAAIWFAGGAPVAGGLAAGGTIVATPVVVSAAGAELALMGEVAKDVYVATQAAVVLNPVTATVAAEVGGALAINAVAGGSGGNNGDDELQFGQGKRTDSGSSSCPPTRPGNYTYANVNLRDLIPDHDKVIDLQRLADHGPWDHSKYMNNPLEVFRDANGNYHYTNGLTRITNALRHGITQLPAKVFPRR